MNRCVSSPRPSLLPFFLPQSLLPPFPLPSPMHSVTSTSNPTSSEKPSLLPLAEMQLSSFASTGHLGGKSPENWAHTCSITLYSASNPREAACCPRPQQLWAQGGHRGGAECRWGADTAEDAQARACVTQEFTWESRRGLQPE